MPGLYWMFIDEVGHAGRKQYRTINERFLSLTGVIIEEREVKRFLIPQLEALKEAHFGKGPDGKPIVLHRVKISREQPPFNLMQNQFHKARFEEELAILVGQLEFSMVTVVLDKKRHEERGREWFYHPYHICMEILIERFIRFLQAERSEGRILVESRGKTEDSYLEHAMDAFHRMGNTWITKYETRRHLPEGCIRFAAKGSNIAGLQIADLVAFPSFLNMYRGRYGGHEPTGLNRAMIETIEDGKYRSINGVVAGYGTKWLPS